MKQNAGLCACVLPASAGLLVPPPQVHATQPAACAACCHLQPTASPCSDWQRLSPVALKTSSSSSSRRGSPCGGQGAATATGGPHRGPKAKEDGGRKTSGRRMLGKRRAREGAGGIWVRRSGLVRASAPWWVCASFSSAQPLDGAGSGPEGHGWLKQRIGPHPARAHPARGAGAALSCAGCAPWGPPAPPRTPAGSGTRRSSRCCCCRMGPCWKQSWARASK